MERQLVILPLTVLRSKCQFRFRQEREELKLINQLSDNRKQLSVDSYQLSDKKKQQDNRQQITDNRQQTTDNRQQN